LQQEHTTLQQRHKEVEITLADTQAELQQTNERANQREQQFSGNLSKAHEENELQRTQLAELERRVGILTQHNEQLQRSVEGWPSKAQDMVRLAVSECEAKDAILLEAKASELRHACGIETAKVEALEQSLRALSQDKTDQLAALMLLKEEELKTALKTQQHTMQKEAEDKARAHKQELAKVMVDLETATRALAEQTTACNSLKTAREGLTEDKHVLETRLQALQDDLADVKAAHAREMEAATQAAAVLSAELEQWPRKSAATVSAAVSENRAADAQRHEARLAEAHAAVANERAQKEGLERAQRAAAVEHEALIERLKENHNKETEESLGRLRVTLQAEIERIQASKANDAEVYTAKLEASRREREELERRVASFQRKPTIFEMRWKHSVLRLQRRNNETPRHRLL
jgi:hypothetical protein